MCACDAMVAEVFCVCVGFMCCSRVRSIVCWPVVVLRASPLASRLGAVSRCRNRISLHSCRDAVCWSTNCNTSCTFSCSNQSKQELRGTEEQKTKSQAKHVHNERQRTIPIDSHKAQDMDSSIEDRDQMRENRSDGQLSNCRRKIRSHTNKGWETDPLPQTQRVFAAADLRVGCPLYAGRLVVSFCASLDCSPGCPFLNCRSKS